MTLTITAIKPATAWNLTLTKLANLEKTITTTERPGLEARWLFGRELMKRRVDYKGRLIVPKDLMRLAIAECSLSKTEITKRVQFAERYPTKSLMSMAVLDYPSWTKMKQKGLSEKPRTKSKPTAVVRSGPWVVRQLLEALNKAFARHAKLTRDQVLDLEAVRVRVDAILTEIDRNDAARAS